MAEDDIGRLLAHRLVEIPTAIDEDEALEFTEESAAELPAVMRTDQIVVSKGHRTVNGCWRVDRLVVRASKETLRGLGLIAMSTMFFPAGRTLELELVHPASDIRLIRCSAPWTDPFLVTRPVSYTYVPRQRDQHPWAGDGVAPQDLPAFWLTDREELGGITQEDWNARDTIVGFGSAAGIAALGQLLLDIGNPLSSGDEYELEGEHGFLGVAPLSADVAIWLPGSLGSDRELGLG